MTVAPKPPATAQLGGAARQGVANLFGAALAAVAGVGLNVLVARSWTEAEAGLYFVATSIFLLGLAVARLGGGVGAVYFISQFRALEQVERIGWLVRLNLLAVTGVGAVLAVAGWWAAPQLVAAFTDTAEPVHGAVTAVRSLALFLPAAAVADAAIAATRGFGTMRPNLYVERLGRNAVQVLTVSAVALAGLSATVYLPIAWAAPYLPTAVVAVAWLAAMVRGARRARPGLPPLSARLRRQVTRAYWAFTGPRALGGVAQMVIQRADIVLVGALRGLAEAAVYTAATRFLALGQLVGGALSTAVQHHLAGHLTRGERDAAGQLYQVATGWLVLITWPIYLLFALFAQPILAVFGDRYTDGRSVTVLLSVAMLLATGCGMVDTVLNMAGRTWWTFSIALVAAGANLAANLLLIPRWGIIGAAVAWVLAIVISNVVPLVWLRRAYGLHPFGRGTLTAMPMALVCFGAVPLVGRLLLGGGLPVLCLVTAVGVLSYAALAWRYRKPLRLGALRALRR